MSVAGQIAGGGGGCSRGGVVFIFFLNEKMNMFRSE